MQHLDEGTIHAWLDGALTANEAARAEAHVKDCPQCQAVVAEARGFIAASSRILTALDNAPRGVIPATVPQRRVQPWMWRVAATALVVATGTLIFLNERGAGTPSRQASTAPLAHDTQSQNSTAAAVESAPSAVETAPSTDMAPTTPSSAPRAAAKTSAQPLRARSPALTPTPAFNAPEADFSGKKAERGARLDEARRAGIAEPQLKSAAPRSEFAPMRARGVDAMDFAGVTPREVDKKRTIGKTQTFYELVTGDTVVLEEQFPVQLEEVVTSGAGAIGGGAIVSGGRAQPQSNRLSGKAAPAAASQQTLQASPPSAPVASLQDAQGEIHRISWLDSSTRTVLILSGRHSQEELEQIRRRIQRLRDAAAQSKKAPD